MIMCKFFGFCLDIISKKGCKKFLTTIYKNCIYTYTN